MAYSINITTTSGGTPPISYYACDEYGNNCSFLGNTTGVYVLPVLLQTANTIMIKSIDSTGCTLFKIISCFSPDYKQFQDLINFNFMDGVNFIFNQ